jgi:hypothetical protein
MNIDGTQLAIAMLSIHAAEMQQAERCPDWLRSARIERHIVLHQGGNRTLCRLGSHLVKIGRRLQQYSMPQPLPCGSKATQCG